MRTLFRSVVILTFLLIPFSPASGQEKSVRPGINKTYENPKVEEFVPRFETESREVFVKNKEIVTACKLRAGMAVADIGAGTGLFARQFARAVGPQGKVYAVDIAPQFVKYVEKTCKGEGLRNVIGVVCSADSTKLTPNSIDLAFICDTYHHFEFPFKTMASIYAALRPGGQVVVVDYRREKGISSDFILSHVRAGKEEVTKEITSCGFRLVEEGQFLKENYLLRFEKAEKITKKTNKPT